MKKIGIMLAVLVLCAVSASATRISKSKAQAKAVSFFQKGLVKANGAEVKLVKEYASSAEAPAAVFAFSRGENVVFVSAEDKMPAILGYSSNADVNNLPPALEEMLRYYAHLSDAVREGRIEAPKLYASAEPVDSLIHTCWYQEAPFWNKCPVYAGMNTADGCVATAFAMVMKYYNWPDKPEGKSPKYTTRTLHIEIPEVDLSSHTYKWDDMINVYKKGTYTEEQGEAVAQLCYDIATASRMNFGIEGSGTPVSVAVGSMRNNFKYNKGLHIDYAKSHTEEEWASMLKNEISQKRPLPYSAFRGDGEGHCFVIDGFNAEGLFHVNWGWGGRSNGFFLITTLNPAEEGMSESQSTSGYYINQSTFFDFVPDKTGTSTPVEHYFFQYSNCTSADNDRFLIAAFHNMSIDDFRGDLILQFVDENGNVAAQNTLKKDYSLTVDEEDNIFFVPNDLFDFSKFADGIYHTEMIAVAKESGKEYPVMHTKPDNIIRIEDGKIKSVIKCAILEGEITGYENFVYTEELFNIKMTVKGQITNVDNIDFSSFVEKSDGLCLYVSIQSNKHVSDFKVDMAMDIKSGETITFEEELDFEIFNFIKDIDNTVLTLKLNTANGVFATKEYPLKELIATGIKDIIMNKVEGKSPAYNINGQRVDASSAKGVVIKDGKKRLTIDD